MVMATAVGLPPLEPLVNANAKRTYAVFASCPDQGIKDEEEKRYEVNVLRHAIPDRKNSARLHLSVKINDEYKHYKQLPAALMVQQGPIRPARPKEQRKAITAGRAHFRSSRLRKSLIVLACYSVLGDEPHDCNNRQITCPNAIYVLQFITPVRSTYSPQDDTCHQTRLPPTMEAHACHFWPSWLGA